MNRTGQLTLALTVGAVLVSACQSSRTSSGTTVPSEHPSGPSAQCQPPVEWLPLPCESDPGPTQPGSPIPTYKPRHDDGRGWSTQAIDQPRPLPSVKWKWKQATPGKGVCGWVDAELLAAFGGNDMDGTTSIECGISIGEHGALVIEQNSFWEPFDGPVGEQFTFMRPLTIAGLQAREFSLTSGEQAAPGSCAVEVNTRSLNHIRVLAARDDNPDPGPTCQQARDAATLIVKRFVPVAGGTPYPGTPQQPAAGVIGVQPKTGPCQLFDGPLTFLENVTGQEGHDGSATTCTWTKGETRAAARLTLGNSVNWQNNVPPLGKNDLAADTKLGGMRALVQLAADSGECAETVEYAPGETVRFAYRNPDRATFSAAELCRIVETALAMTLNTWTDSTAR